MLIKTFLIGMLSFPMLAKAQATIGSENRIQPSITLGGFPPGDTIPRGSFVAQPGLSCNASCPPDLMNPRCRIDNYVIEIVRNGEIIYTGKQNGRVVYSKETTAAIRELHAGDCVYFSNIFYITPAGHRKKYNDLAYCIK
jgi:hypothetical protein